MGGLRASNEEDTAYLPEGGGVVREGGKGYNERVCYYERVR